MDSMTGLRKKSKWESQAGGRFDPPELDVFRICNYRNCGTGIKIGKQTSHALESQPNAST